MTVKDEIIQLLKSTKRKGMNALIEYLEASDFFTAPASTKYHGCWEGGLAEHSLNVYNCLKFSYGNLKDSEGFCLPDIPEDSLIIASLLHDVCKVNTYHEKEQWYKDEQGKWQSRPGYERVPLLPMGHGGKSIFILQQFISLTVQESLSIFWHMGAYDISQYNTVNEMGQAYENDLLAFLLHQADMLSTYVAENNNYTPLQ